VIHGKGLTVEVCRRASVDDAPSQVDRHKGRVRIPRDIEIDRKLHTRPFRLRHRRVGAKQIIESSDQPTTAIANQPSTETSLVICSCTEKRVRRFRISKEMLRPEASPSRINFHPEI